jgi:hypothetical protein
MAEQLWTSQKGLGFKELLITVIGKYNWHILPAFLVRMEKFRICMSAVSNYKELNRKSYSTSCMYIYQFLVCGGGTR